MVELVLMHVLAFESRSEVPFQNKSPHHPHFQQTSDVEDEVTVTITSPHSPTFFFFSLQGNLPETYFLLFAL